MKLFLLIIISHLIGDFLFQSKNIVNLKENNKIKGYMFHGFIIFTITFCLIFYYGIKIAFILSLLISIIHTIIDFIKEKITNESSTVELYAFIGDQLLHFFTIFLVWKYFRTNMSIPVFNNDLININLLNINTTLNKILIFIIFYLLVLFTGAVLLEKILNVIDVEMEEDGDNIRLGKYIGIIERAIILTLVTFGSLSSIGIIFTAKSLARFRELNKKTFVEYYLLGTLSSIFIALVGGLLLKNVFI